MHLECDTSHILHHIIYSLVAEAMFLAYNINVRQSGFTHNPSQRCLCVSGRKPGRKVTPVILSARENISLWL